MVDNSGQSQMIFINENDGKEVKRLDLAEWWRNSSGVLVQREMDFLVTKISC